MDTDTTVIAKSDSRIPACARGQEAEALGFVQGLGSGVVSRDHFKTAMDIFPHKELHVVAGERGVNLGMIIKGAGRWDTLITAPGGNLTDLVPDEYSHLATIQEFVDAGQTMADHMERTIVIRRVFGGKAELVRIFHPVTIH